MLCEARDAKVAKKCFRQMTGTSDTVTSQIQELLRCVYDLSVEVGSVAVDGRGNASKMVTASIRTPQR